MPKFYKIAILAATAFAASMLAIYIVLGYNAQKRIAEGISQLPPANFQSIDGQMVALTSFDPNKAVVVRYFHPDCGYCQYEASEIAAYANHFSEIQIIMVTPDDSIQRVSQFATEYNLYEIDNLIILIDPNQKFQQTFGKATLPSTYIYDRQQKLLVRFQGETHPEAILKVLNTTLLP